MSYLAVLTRSRFARPWSDSVIAALVFVLAALWGARFITSGTLQPQFYQWEFTPAVMEACGRGFVMLRNLSDVPGLEDFLQLRSPAFNCDQIPSGLDLVEPNRGFQQIQRYLLGAVAVNWRLTGISWDGLLILYALLFGISSAAAYGIFRLAMDKPVAAVFATLFLLSPLQLNNLPHLRDYAKAPFIIGIVLALAWFVKVAPSPRKTVLIAALLGAVLGAGLGFRMDLLIFVPAVLVTLAVFTPSGVTRDLGPRLSAMAACSVTFVALAWPILSAMGGGGNSFHFILLGLFSPFDEVLRIQPSPVYELGYRYNDVYTEHILSSYVHRIWNVDTPLELATQAYDQAGAAYYLEVARHFPADIVTRFLAAALAVIHNTAIGLKKLAPLLVLVSLLLMAAFRLRIAVFATVAVLYLCAYPALQFHERHYFHLELVPLFFCGFLVQQLVNHRRQLRGRTSGAGSSESLFTRLQFPAGAGVRVLVLAMLLMIPVALLVGLRMYQQWHVTDLLKNHEQLTIGDGKVEVVKLATGSVRLRPQIAAQPSAYRIHTGYWAVELDGSVCGQNKVDLAIQYRSSVPFYDNSRRITFDTRSPLRYVFHTYSSGPYGGVTDFNEFVGIEVSADGLRCIKKFGRLEGFERLPLLMNLTFRDGWEDQPLYQTIVPPRLISTRKLNSVIEGVRSFLGSRLGPD